MGVDLVETVGGTTEVGEGALVGIGEVATGVRVGIGVLGGLSRLIFKMP
jgi:hypothetical protein